jgi:hypothetical protein
MLAIALTLLASLQSKPVVAVDGNHNDETPPHYTWDDPKLGGYSQLFFVSLCLCVESVLFCFFA